MGSQPSHGSFVGHNPQQQAPAPTASNASLGNLKSMADVEAGVSSGANGKRRNWKVISFLRSLSAKLSRSLKIDSTPEKKVRKSITRSGCAIGILSVLLSGVIVAFIIREIPRHRANPINGAEMIVSRWGLPSPSAQRGLATWPTDFSRDIKPIPCHSHNDYWRHVPLYDALAAGCTGVEADVWSSSKLEDDLYVGHDHNSLKSERTLKSLYIDPLLTILNNQNKPSPLFSPNQTSLLPSSIDPKVGIFDSSPSTSLTLLIDLKTAADTTFPIVLAALQPLLQANYLTTYSPNTGIIPGPITVVATGNTKFTANILSPANTDPIRSIFFDAPLPALSDLNPSAEDLLYSTDNSYYASVSFSEAISTDHFMQMTDKQVEKVRKQIQAAKAKGLVSRYWDTPDWPQGKTREVWGVLKRAGVGVFSTDHLATFQEFWDGEGDAE